MIGTIWPLIVTRRFEPAQHLDRADLPERAADAVPVAQHVGGEAGFGLLGVLGDEAAQHALPMRGSETAHHHALRIDHGLEAVVLILLEVVSAAVKFW